MLKCFVEDLLYVEYVVCVVYEMVIYEENIVENKYDMLGFEVVYLVIG